MSRDTDYEGRLAFIRQHVEGLWKNNKYPEKWYTIHDHTHCKNVENALNKLLPETPMVRNINNLSDEEKFYLFAAAWLHDVGMLPDNENFNYDIIRKNHHIYSNDYVLNNHTILQLDYDEAYIIGQICLFHRRSKNIMDCSKTNSKIRQRLLASYLRLADAIDIGPERVDQSIFINHVFFDFNCPMDTKYHWLKNFLCKDVNIDFETLTITIEFLLTSEDNPDVKEIVDLIKDDVRSELMLVRDVLIYSGISYFLNVDAKLETPVPKKFKPYLSQLIGDIKLKRKLSASDVMQTLVDTLLSIMDLTAGLNTHKIILAYQHQVINDLLANRPCHVLIKRINNIIDKNLITKDESKLTLEKAKKEISDLRTSIEQLKKDRAKSMEQLFLQTEVIFLDCGSMLLCGCSNMVVEALGKARNSIKEKTTIYICECKSKNQYNDVNELVYCDGIEYASKIKKIGYQNVILIPDILVGNLISLGKISKIIFGANGVHINLSAYNPKNDLQDGTFGHTAGHRTIADIAHLYHVPVYVILDSYKFMAFEQKPDLERNIPWITGDKKALAKLDGVEQFNPRYDVVEPYKVYFLITDCGMFPPHQIPDDIKRKASE